MPVNLFRRRLVLERWRRTRCLLIDTNVLKYVVCFRTLQGVCVAAAKDGNFAKELREGCTGPIIAGQYLVKAWTKDFLHYHCAKRLWKVQVRTHVDL